MSLRKIRDKKHLIYCTQAFCIMIGFIFFFFKKRMNSDIPLKKGFEIKVVIVSFFLFSKGKILIFLINKFNLTAVIEMITKPHNSFIIR